MSFIVFTILVITVVFIAINLQENQKKQKVSQRQNRNAQESENNQEERQDVKTPRLDLFAEFQAEPKNKESSFREKCAPHDDIVNSPVVVWSKNPDHYGIPIGFSKGLHQQRAIVFIRPCLYKYSRTPPNVSIHMYEFDEDEVFAPPKNNKFYVLEQISQTVKNYYLNIAPQSECLRLTILEIEYLKKQVESNIYLQQSKLYPQDIDKIYNLIKVDNYLYDKHRVLMLNILTAHKLIRYDIENFPDISDELVQLARECDNFSNQFKIIKNEIDTYENLKRECPTFQEIYFRKFRVEDSELLG